MFSVMWTDGHTEMTRYVTAPFVAGKEDGGTEIASQRMDTAVTEFFTIFLFSSNRAKIVKLKVGASLVEPTVIIQGTGPPFVLIETACTLAIATLAVKIWILVAVVNSAKQALNTPLHSTMKNSLIRGDLI